MIRRCSPPLVAALLLVGACRPREDEEAKVRERWVHDVVLDGGSTKAFWLASRRDVWFDEGWYPAETEPFGNILGKAWRWMGSTSTTKLRVVAEADTPLRVVGWVPYDLVHAPPTVRFTIDGRQVGFHVWPRGEVRFDMIVPQAMLAGARFVTLAITTSSVGQPRDDARLLGFALTSLRWGGETEEL